MMSHSSRYLLLRTLLSSLFLAGLMSSMSANALLIPGAVAPDFTVEAALAGKPVTVTLSEALQKGPVILWFFPKAFTSGCTKEANLFAETTTEFAALGATVIGMSNDVLSVAQEFSVKEAHNAFLVAADPEGQVIQSYDARMLFGVSTAKRVTYVITPDGKILYAYSDMGPKEHISRALEAVKAWKTNTPATSP